MPCKFKITMHYIFFTNVKHGFHLFSFLPCPCLILLSSIQYCFSLFLFFPLYFFPLLYLHLFFIIIIFFLDGTSEEEGKWHAIGVRKSRHYRRQEINFINNVILFYKQLILISCIHLGNIHLLFVLTFTFPVLEMWLLAGIHTYISVILFFFCIDPNAFETVFIIVLWQHRQQLNFNPATS